MNPREEFLAFQLQADRAVGDVVPKDQAVGDTIGLWLFSLEIVVFGILAVLLTSYLISKGHDTWGVLRGVGIITIVVIAALLVIGGYGPEQISGAIGLLGSIAGYLLGKKDSSSG